MNLDGFDRTEREYNELRLSYEESRDRYNILFLRYSVSFIGGGAVAYYTYKVFKVGVWGFKAGASSLGATTGSVTIVGTVVGGVAGAAVGHSVVVCGETLWFKFKNPALYNSYIGAQTLLNRLAKHPGIDRAVRERYIQRERETLDQAMDQVVQPFLQRLQHLEQPIPLFRTFLHFHTMFSFNVDRGDQSLTVAVTDDGLEGDRNQLARACQTLEQEFRDAMQMFAIALLLRNDENHDHITFILEGDAGSLDLASVIMIQAGYFAYSRNIRQFEFWNEGFFRNALRDDYQRTVRFNHFSNRRICDEEMLEGRETVCVVQ